jgi:hypothetical protein
MLDRIQVSVNPSPKLNQNGHHRFDRRDHSVEPFDLPLA